MAHNEWLNVDSLLQDNRCCCGPHLNAVVTPETCSVYVAYTYQSPKSDKALRSHSLSITGWWLLVKLSRVQLHASNWRSQHFNHLLKCPLISPFFPNFLPCLLQIVLFWRHDDEEPELAEEELVLGCRWCLCWYSFWHVAPAEGDEEFGADWTRHKSNSTPDE